NSNVDFSTATPSVPYTLHTLTPDQQAWFTTNGVTWPSDITATAWLPADNTLGANNQRLGTPYSNITAGATTTAFADQRPLYPTYTQALNSVANHLYSTIPVTATDPDPIDQTVAAGTAATFSSTVANVAGLNAVYGPLTYQWQSNADSDNWYDLDDSSSYYDGSNTPTLTIHGGLGGIDDSFTGDYRLVVKTPILPANNPYDQAPSTGAAVLLTTSPVTLTIANPYITLDASANVNINLNPATNPLGGVSDNLVVKTDAALGYSLSVSMSGSDNRLGNGNGSYINPTAGTLNDPLALNVNTWGFAMNSSAAIAGNGFDASYTTPTPNAAARFAAIPINTSPLLIRQTGVTNETGDNVTIYYGADADMTRPAGTYTGTVLFTVVAN
ncbi:hypothetical protein FWF48_04160, partial [Candidatus Saccharibacteria bacterium]|nr:hypothetical protein [Candidatus Saccharibacteria bacterium]